MLSTCDGNNNVIKSQFLPPRAYGSRSNYPNGSEKLAKLYYRLPKRVCRLYIYIYTSDRPTFNKITPLSFPSSLQRAISVIDNESRVNYECIIIHLREEVVKKGFRHDYEIQSARLKWPIAANYRRLNHFLPLPILPIPVSLIYPCIYGVQRVLVFFLPISNLVG